MDRRDFFDNFVKFAEENKQLAEKAKKTLEKTQRADSLDIKLIESLYNTQNDQFKELIDSSHKDSAVLFQSYDRLNGLIENNQERQNIILNILNKAPTGQLFTPKYAKDQLILSLVRLGNALDVNHQEDLRNLTDTCLMQLTNETLNKKAAAPLAAGLAVGVSSLLGALYVQQHMDFINEGFQTNHNKLIAEIDDLLNSSSQWGVGYTYTAHFIKIVRDFKNKLLNFYQIYLQILPLIVDLETPRTATELLQKADTSEAAVKAYRALNVASQNMSRYIQTIETNFSSESYKARQIEDKGWLTSLLSKTQVLHGGKGLIADDFDDVVRAIGPYKESILELLKMLKQASEFEQSTQQQINQAVEQSKLSAPDNLKDDLDGDLESSLQQMQEIFDLK
jgi:hypothetical protein